MAKMTPFQKAMAILLLPAAMILTNCSKKMDHLNVYCNQSNVTKSTNDSWYVEIEFDAYYESGSKVEPEDGHASQASIAIAQNNNSANAVDYSMTINGESAFITLTPEQIPNKDSKWMAIVHYEAQNGGSVVGSYPSVSVDDWETEMVGDELKRPNPNPAIYGPWVSSYGLDFDILEDLNLPDTNAPAGRVVYPGDFYTGNESSVSTTLENITIKAGDDEGVQSVTLYSRRTNGGGSWQPVSATYSSGSNWTANASLENNPGHYQFYAEIKDTSNNTFDTSMEAVDMYGTEAWGHSVFLNYWENVLPGLNTNYGEDITIGPYHTDFKILEKGGSPLTNQSTFNYRLQVGDEGNSSDDAQFTIGGYDPVISADNLEEKDAVEIKVQYLWDNSN